MKLELENLTKRYSEQTVIDNITAEFDFPHVLALLGPSGGGKSTLLRLIGGLIHPDNGEIKIDGEAVPSTENNLRSYRSHIGTVFQSWNLFPHMTALANVMLPLTAVHNVAEEEAKARSLDLLERLQLAKHVQKRPAELSGGQRQRVAIARAVVIRPKLLLFDEPTSALDPEMTAEILDVIADLKAEGRTFILVTHAMNFARKVADQVAFVTEGRIADHGNAESFFAAPQTAKARQFLERVLQY